MKSEAVAYLSQWTPWLLAIIPIGAGLMITYQAIRQAFTTDLTVVNDCKNKIVNVIKGAIIGICISGIVNFIRSLYM